MWRGLFVTRIHCVFFGEDQKTQKNMLLLIVSQSVFVWIIWWIISLSSSWFHLFRRRWRHCWPSRFYWVQWSWQLKWIERLKAKLIDLDAQVATADGLFGTGRKKRHPEGMVKQTSSRSPSFVIVSCRSLNNLLGFLTKWIQQWTSKTSKRSCVIFFFGFSGHTHGELEDVSIWVFVLTKMGRWKKTRWPLRQWPMRIWPKYWNSLWWPWNGPVNGGKMMKMWGSFFIRGQILESELCPRHPSFI